MRRLSRSIYRIEAKEMSSSSPDRLMRAILKAPAMRLAIGSFRELAAEGIVRHDADPLAGLLLADALSAAALLSSMQTEGERATIRIGYEGPAGSIVADAAPDGSVRGFIRNPHVMAAAATLEAACGEAGATVRFTRSRAGRILGAGESKNAFLLPSPALACHLSVSEEIESEIRCEFEFRPDPKQPVAVAAGMLLQAQPGCDLGEFEQVRNRLQTAAAGNWLRNFADDPESALRDLLAFLTGKPEAPEFALTRLSPARFRCGCSAEHLRNAALGTLGREEIDQLLRENPNPALRCQFCNAEYRLSADDFR